MRLFFLSFCEINHLKKQPDLKKSVAGGIEEVDETDAKVGSSLTADTFQQLRRRFRFLRLNLD